MPPEPIERDFFISRAGADAAWAKWVAQVLREEGFTTFLQDEDSGPGRSFISHMNDGAGMRTLALFSPEYFLSPHTTREWGLHRFGRRGRGAGSLASLATSPSDSLPEPYTSATSTNGTKPSTISTKSSGSRPAARCGCISRITIAGTANSENWRAGHNGSYCRSFALIRG